jgi:DNA-binding CsgD family transcriptional regulator
MIPSPAKNFEDNKLSKEDFFKEKLDDSLLWKENLLSSLKAASEKLIHGVLVLTDSGKILYANTAAYQILDKLAKDCPESDFVPKEVQYICQSLIGSRDLFPDQHWSIEFKILVNQSVTLRVRVRWLKLESIFPRCLFLSIEDERQFKQNFALEEVRRYDLTSREREIWLLHQDKQTYQQIASKLHITPSTVKKHMRNIRAKQKASK